MDGHRDGVQCQHPETNSPTAWRTADGHQAAWSEADWWRAFGSSQLDELIAQAEAANYDLSAAIARVREADAQARIAGAALLPSVGATAGLPTGGGTGDTLRSTRPFLSD